MHDTYVGETEQCFLKETKEIKKKAEDDWTAKQYWGCMGDKDALVLHPLPWLLFAIWT